MCQPLQLQIVEPCHEKWHEMTLQQQGRFCGSCQKIVIDFSSMNDQQLLAYFKNYKGNICGRFDDSQLLRPLLAPRPQKPGWIKWAIASLFSFILLSKAKAQGQVLIKCSQEQVQPIVMIGKVNRASLPQIGIKGKAAEENGVGIPYASVQVKGDMWGVSADSLGNYSLRLPAGIDSIVLVYSATGFKGVEVKFATSETFKQIQDITLTPNSCLPEVIVRSYQTMGKTYVAGGVSTVTRVRTKKVLQSKEASPVQSNLYPNPAKAGSTIHLRFGSAGNFDLRIVDASGRIIMTKSNLSSNAGKVQQFVLLATIAAGQYFVQVLDDKGKTVVTEKLVIVR